jgi:hypothetical protein
MATDNSNNNKQALNETDFNWDSPDVSFFGVTDKTQSSKLKDPGTLTKIGVTLEDEEDTTPNDDDIDWANFGYSDPKDEEDSDDDEDEDDKKPASKAKPKVSPLQTAEDDDEDDDDDAPPTPKRKTDKSSQTAGDGAGEEGDALYLAVATELKNRKIFANVEIPDNVDEDTMFQLMDDELEARLEGALDEYDEALRNNPEAIALLRFMKDGGNTSDFVNVYGQSKLPSEVDLKKEVIRDAFLRQHYREVEGLDAEDTEDKLEWLKESGKADKFALKHLKEATETRQQAQQELLQAQYARKKRAEESVIQFRQVIRQTVDKADVIGDVKISAKDKRELPEYISKHSVKSGPTQLVTQLQKDIADIFADPQQLVVLAKFVKGGMKAGNLEAAAATTKVGKIKNTLRDAMEGRNKTGPVGKKPGKSLADAWGSRG